MRIPADGLKKFVFVAMLLVAGCDGPASAPEVPDARDGAATELPWERQVSAVREGRSSEIRISAQPVRAEQWLGLADGCENLAVLDVEALETPGASLSLLSKLGRLRQLRIGSPVGDAGLREIARAGSLQVLNLPRGEFTDDGLRELAALPRLELLRFHSLHVTDAGMQHIAAMPALRFLHLIGVPITDAGLLPLHKLGDLESFYLDGGACTDDGLARLLRELPELHFHHNQLHLPDDPHAHPHADGATDK